MKKLILMFVMVTALIIAGCSSKSTTGDGDKTAEADFPKKTIEIINPFPAGGATDTVARAIAKVMPKYLPNEQQVLVVNNPLGGVGSIGATKVINSKPDGYTVGLTPVSTIVVQPHFGEVSYSYDDVQPVVELSSSEGMLVVSADAPYDTFEEWLSYVEENPGKFKYSTAGAGSIQHIQAERLIATTEIDIKHVPYNGTAESTTALLGKHVDGAIMQPSQASEHIEAGTFKALAFMGSAKAKGFEDIPLLTEVGVDVAVDNFNLVFAPKDIPEETFAVLQKAFQEALADPEVVSIIESSGDTPKTTIGQELEDKVESTYISSGEAIEASGLAK